MVSLKQFRKILSNSLTLVAASLVFVSIQSVYAIIPRSGHGTVLLNNKLYVFGGKVGESSSSLDVLDNSNELLILDMKIPFSVSNPSWTTYNVGPRVAYHTISIGGPQNELLVLYGGIYFDRDVDPLYYYNTSDPSPVWIKANLSLGLQRMQHTVVTRLSDSMNYFFGGIPNVLSPSEPAILTLQELINLDTRKNIWNVLKLDQNTPSGRYQHTATIFSDGKMYLTGGAINNPNNITNETLVDMNQIYVYDTMKSRWDYQVAIGNMPLPRREHAAVGTHDGRLIIHGGVSQDYNTIYDDIAILDVTKLPYTWTVIEAKGIKPQARYSHTATMVGTNLLVAFGVTGYLTNGRALADNYTYILDTKTFTWIDQYTPENLEFTDTAPSSNTHTGFGIPNNISTNTMRKTPIALILGLTIGSITVLSLIGGLFWFYRKRKQNSSYRLYNSGTNDREQMSNQVILT
ncbi:4695_t:CDS:2 [Funneliformis geosporum]|uniref:921_t:CDS:1 n=1 Tax=Funneliformis geosporum TaxID=1117311 RepID=A0A9W4SZ58_9GLOM|nr:921_t:CDS:2 [Funneliformis geosporum]CAI2187109.1 4695_t:CDS:2 [Funneliformis geosporum]